MKTSVLHFILVAVLIFAAIYSKGQTASSQLNQRDLIRQFEGKWQAPAGKDSFEVWNWSPYGKSYHCSIHVKVGGKETPLYINTCSFNEEMNKFIGAAVFYGGWAMGWNGAFTSPKKLSLEIYTLAAPAKVTGKVEFTFNTPDSFTFSNTNTNGTVSILNFSRIK